MIAPACLASLTVTSALINQPVQHVLSDTQHQTVLYAIQDMMDLTALIVILIIIIPTVY